MLFSQKFRSFSRKTCTLNEWVAAPYMRRDFKLSKMPQKAELTVCALGFYELFVNGKKITKGHLSPYIVNPDQVLPYDTYDVSSLLNVGDNVVAFILGKSCRVVKSHFCNTVLRFLQHGFCVLCNKKALAENTRARRCSFYCSMGFNSKSHFLPYRHSKDTSKFVSGFVRSRVLRCSLAPQQ